MKKIIALLILLIFSSTSLAIQEEGVFSAKQQWFIDSVLEQLNLKENQCYCKLATVKQLPFKSKDTVVVIPELDPKYNEDEVMDFDSHILVVDTQSSKIKSSFYESAETNGWTSDAIRLYEIKIDTARYNLNNSYRAFGIRVIYEGSSRVNPFAHETLSLFLPQEKTLKRVLKNLNVYSHQGEWNGNCNGEITIHSSIIEMSSNKTNGFQDIIVTTLSKQEEAQEENDDCIDTVINQASSTQTLRYTDGQYHLTKNEQGKLYRGTIDDRIPVELRIETLANHFYQNGNITVGTLRYLNSKSKKPLTVVGESSSYVSQLTSIILKEFTTSGNITGKLFFKPFGNGLIGEWENPSDYDNSFKIKLDFIKNYTPKYTKIPNQKLWFGDYAYAYGEKGYQGNFSLKKNQNGIPTFDLFSVTHAPGRNIADISHEVKLISTGFVLAPLSNTPSCKIKTQFFNGFATVEYTNSDAYESCQFGHNATAEGIFIKIK